MEVKEVVWVEDFGIWENCGSSVEGFVEDTVLCVTRDVVDVTMTDK